MVGRDPSTRPTLSRGASEREHLEVLARREPFGRSFVVYQASLRGHP